MAHGQSELHKAGRINWLRAAVLGANDDAISVASLVVGVASGDENGAGYFIKKPPAPLFSLKQIAFSKSLCFIGNYFCVADRQVDNTTLT